MVLLNPLYLWALLGLAIPVAIHLWSRKEGRTIKVGSIKFLREANPRQASSIKLNEIWLLVLRMLALAILVFILAGPVLHRESSVALTYLVEPSLLQHEEISGIFDTIGPGNEIRLLAQDFPHYSAGEVVQLPEIPDYWQLAREMQTLNTDSVVVFTAAYAAGLYGKRPVINSNANWITLSPDESIDKPFYAVQKEDNFEIFSVAGGPSGLRIEKELNTVTEGNFTVNSTKDSLILEDEADKMHIPLRGADTLKINLFYDEDLKDQVRYVRTSLNAISEYLDRPMQIMEQTEENPDNGEEDLLIWLSTASVKETKAAILLIYKQDSLANDLIIKGKTHREYFLTQTLNSENIVMDYFPEQLLGLLNINKEIEQEINKYDLRVMPREEILPVTASVVGDKEINEAHDISHYLWILLGILLIAERGFSAYRNQ